MIALLYFFQRLSLALLDDGKPELTIMMKVDRFRKQSWAGLEKMAKRQNAKIAITSFIYFLSPKTEKNEGA